MKTIETTAAVGPDRKLVVQLPPDVTVGMHRVVVVIEEAAQCPAAPPHPNWPRRDVGPWPHPFSLSREELYGDGR